jgi:tetratricopeptide (TPR) repeat protein
MSNRLFVTTLSGLLLAAPLASPAAAQQAPPSPSASSQSRPTDPVAQRQAAYEKYVEAEKAERAGENFRAIELYKQAIDLAPDDPQPRVALARVYLADRNTEAARAEAETVLKGDPDSTPARAVLVEILLTEALSGGAIDKPKAQLAVAELEKIVAKDPEATITLGNTTRSGLELLAQLYQLVGDEKKALEAFEKLSRSGETTAESYVSLARLYFDQRRYRDAARAAGQARKIDGTNLDALGILGRSLLRSGRAAEAVEAYQAALKAIPEAGPQSQLADLQRLRDATTIDYADALVQAGRYKEAVDTLKPILERYPNLVPAVRITTDANRRAGNREAAIATLEKSLEGQDVSDSLELVFALAETYEEMEQFDKAIETYEEALAVLVNPDGSVEPDDKQNASVILRRIADAHRFAGRKEKAIETYARMRKVLGPEDTTADILQIRDAVEAADYATAIALAHSAGAKATGDDKRTFAFFEAQALGRKGDLAAAVKLLDGLMTGGDEDDEVYAFLSTVQLDAGDAAGAEKSIRKALAKDPNDTGLLITLSSIQDKAAQYAESEKTLRRVLDLDPDNATALNNLGYFLTERGERLDEALDLIQRAVNIDPTNGSFLDSLGWAYFKTGKMPEAKRYLEQAVVYDHQSATIREHLGDLYVKLGDTVKARKYWQEALRLSNEREEVARLKDKLKE